MTTPRSTRYEVTVVHGLEELSRQELKQKLGKGLRFASSNDLTAQGNDDDGALQFDYRGNPARLLQLTTISNAFAISSHDVPRPKALCDQRQLSSLVERIKRCVQLYPPGSPQNFQISAAGSDSAVMQRLIQLLEKALGLPYVDDEVDLLLRIRPARLQTEGWEVLIRLSPRPLSLRTWRVSAMKGALFAPVASSLVRLTQPNPSDAFLNLACGSGTLLIERLIDGPARRVIGCDVSVDALDHARKNLAAAQVTSFVELQKWDARSLNLPDRSIDAICADLPYGIAVGDHEDNVQLYPALLREAARVAKPKGRFVLITQEANLMTSILERTDKWRLEQEILLSLRGLHPRIYVLERTTRA